MAPYSLERGFATEKPIECQEDASPEALHEAELHYRLVADFAYDWEYWEGPDGAWRYVSPSCERITGYPAERFVREPQLLDELILPEDRKTWLAHRHVVEEREMAEVQFRIQTRAGEVRWIEHACQPVTDKEGRFLGYRASNRDITERKWIEKELERHCKRLEELVDERTAELAQANAALREEIAERKQAELQLREVKEMAEEARRAAEAAWREEEKRCQEADRRRQIAESLGDVLAALNSNQSLDKVLDFIVIQAANLFDSEAVAIYSVQRGAGTLTIQAAQDWPMGYVAGSDLSIGQEALRQAISYRQPIAIRDVVATLADNQDVTLDTEWQALLAPWIELYQTLLAVPIVVEDEVYGGILLCYAQPREFSTEDVELAVVFGDQVALAIENARLRDQIQQAATTAERNRLARDLHDAVTQTIFSASLIAEALPRISERHPDEARQGLEELRQLTRGALAEMRTMLLELRPATLTEKSLGELLGALTEAVTSRTRVPITLAVRGDGSLPASVQIALYRIAQEALNNVAKHASANQVAVNLHCEPQEVTLSVRDDGIGFDQNDILPNQLGVGIMHERAESIGASLQVDSQPGYGAQVVIHWENGSG